MLHQSREQWYHMRSSARPADRPKLTRRTVRLRRVPVLTAVAHCGVYCDSHRLACVLVRMPSMSTSGHALHVFSRRCGNVVAWTCWLARTGCALAVAAATACFASANAGLKHTAEPLWSQRSLARIGWCVHWQEHRMLHRRSAYRHRSRAQCPQTTSARQPRRWPTPWVPTRRWPTYRFISIHTIFIFRPFWIHR